MTIRAKMRCVAKSQDQFAHSVEMTPVTTGSEENKAFFKATPGGSVKLGVVSPDVAAAFVVGEDYYVDFTPAPKA